MPKKKKTTDDPFPNYRPRTTDDPFPNYRPRDALGRPVASLRHSPPRKCRTSSRLAELDTDYDVSDHAIVNNPTLMPIDYGDDILSGGKGEGKQFDEDGSVVDCDDEDDDEDDADEDDADLMLPMMMMLMMTMMIVMIHCTMVNCLTMMMRTTSIP